jgi:hypothetical protein
MSATQSQSEIMQDIGGSVLVGRGTLGSHSAYSLPAATNSVLWTVSPDKPSTFSVSAAGAGSNIDLPPVATTAVDVTATRASSGYQVFISNTGSNAFGVRNSTGTLLATLVPLQSVLFIADFPSVNNWILAANTAGNADTLQTAYNNQRVAGAAAATITLDTNVAAPTGEVSIRNNAGDTQLDIFRVQSGSGANDYLRVSHITSGTANDPAVSVNSGTATGASSFVVNGGTASAANAVAIGGASATAAGAIALARAGSAAAASSTLVGSAASTVSVSGASSLVLASANVGNTVAYNQANSVGIVTSKQVLIGRTAAGTIVMPGAAGTTTNEITYLGVDTTTANATPATILSITVPSGASTSFVAKIHINNATTATERGTIEIRGVAYNNGGTTTVGTLTFLRVRPGSLIATNANAVGNAGAIDFTVTGIAATNINWRAVVTTQEYL